MEGHGEAVVPGARGDDALGRSAALSCKSRFAAPRSLNDPVIWRFSSFTKHCVRVRSESVCEYAHGVS